jgi:hypothetical protein
LTIKSIVFFAIISIAVLSSSNASSATATASATVRVLNSAPHVILPDPNQKFFNSLPIPTVFSTNTSKDLEKNKKVKGLIYHRSENDMSFSILGLNKYSSVHIKTTGSDQYLINDKGSKIKIKFFISNSDTSIFFADNKGNTELKIGAEISEDPNKTYQAGVYRGTYVVNVDF